MAENSRDTPDVTPGVEPPSAMEHALQEEVRRREETIESRPGDGRHAERSGGRRDRGRPERGERKLADDDEPSGSPGWGHGLFLVLLVDVVAIAGSLPLIWFMPWDVNGGFWFAGALAIVVFTTFFGIFARTGSIRSSLAATLFLAFMMMAIFIMNVSGFRDFIFDNAFAKSVFDTVTAMVGTVLAFYMGGEAYVAATKAKEAGRTRRARLSRDKSSEV